MGTYCIPYESTNIQRTLTQEYLQSQDHLNAFYEYEPSLEAMEKAIADRQNYEVDRERLFEVLSEQYQAICKDFFESDEHQPVAANIRALKRDHAYTVTTGHQLNILGGPLFYFYKIASTIHLANQLKDRFPDYDFVPVYWMGSEDHDFDEINNIHLMGETYTWEKPMDGSVGALDPSSLKSLVEAIKTNIREQEAFQPLAELWEYAFDSFSTYSMAVRYWIHQLFKDYGLVILDPNDTRLKQAMIGVFEEDLTSQSHEKLVNKWQESLSGYDLPVNPRPINLFYSEKGLRERIVQNGQGYEVLNTDRKYSKEELLKMLHHDPGFFSPNVVLRPLYQQIILPNLAYIGGTNEIAYWLELKGIFNHHKVFFPQLLVRKSVLWVGKGIRKKMDKFNLTEKDLFRPVDEVVREYVAGKEDTAPFEDKIKSLREEYESLMTICEDYNDEMKWPIIELAKQHLKDLEKLRKDTRKLVKKRNEKDINQIYKIYNALFPDGIPQERYENFIPYYTRFGQDFFTRLVRDCDPYKQELLVYKD